MEILCRENVLSKENHSIVLRSVETESFDWYLIKDIASNGNQLDDITQYAFRHRLWWKNEKVSGWANLFEPLISICSEIVGNKIIFVPKVILNMNMNYGLQNGNLSHCDGFMDMETEVLKRYTGIYYLNDSDGDTLFYSHDGQTVIESVAPKANTMVVFKSGLMHSRQLPLVANTRLVLNINILVDVS